MADQVKLTLVTNEDWVDRVDEWIDRQPDRMNRSAAIRQLVNLALDGAGPAPASAAPDPDQIRAMVTAELGEHMDALRAALPDLAPLVRRIEALEARGDAGVRNATDPAQHETLLAELRAQQQSIELAVVNQVDTDDPLRPVLLGMAGCLRVLSQAAMAALGEPPAPEPQPEADDDDQDWFKGRGAR